MKTQTNTTTTAQLTVLLFAIVWMFPFAGSAQVEWTKSENWLATYQQVMGRQASPAWMLDKATEAEDILKSQDGTSFALLLANEYADATEVIAELESPVVDGNGTQLLPISAPESIGVGTYRTEYAGTLAGQPVRLICICNWSTSGNGQTVILVAAGSGSYTLPVQEADELALSMMQAPTGDSLVKK